MFWQSPWSKIQQNSEYGKVLNMARFSSVLEGSWIHVSIMQSSESRICIDRVLDISLVLNMPMFWLWHGSENARVKQGSK